MSPTLLCAVVLLVFMSSFAHALPAFSHHLRNAEKRDSVPKSVVAHFIVGNAYPYTLDNWASDILLAHAHGIDAFALNVGSDSWQPDRVRDAYQAAQNSRSGFQLFLSFDMTVLPCASPDDAQTLRTYITTYAAHPNQFKLDGRVFASTFAGESCAFGHGSPADGWRAQFTQHAELAGQNAVFFAPSFFVDPATFSQFSGAMDGALNWNGAWPISLTVQSANSLLSGLGASLAAATNVVSQALSPFVGAVDTDHQYVNGLNGVSASGPKAYVATVSPWFFTHYSPQTYNKNFIYYADEHLYPTRWDALIANRNLVDLVEIVTWNDYGESHYIGPIEGAQPDSHAWVDGLEHTAFLAMTAYYAAAFKTGAYPAIAADSVYLWARTHPRAAAAPDPVGRPANADLSQDALWALVFAAAPGTVTLATADGARAAQTFAVPAGVSKLSVPLTPGGYMRATLVRGGETVVDLRPAGFTFDANPQTYNYNVFAAYAGAE